MTGPVNKSFTVRRGNTGHSENDNGIVFEMVGAFNYEFHLKTAGLLGGALVKTSPAEITVVGDLVTIPLTLADNEAIVDEGTAIAFEIERRAASGTQRTIIVGNLIGVEGLTND